MERLKWLFGCSSHTETGLTLRAGGEGGGHFDSAPAAPARFYQSRGNLAWISPWEQLNVISLLCFPAFTLSSSTEQLNLLHMELETKGGERACVCVCT